MNKEIPIKLTEIIFRLEKTRYTNSPTPQKKYCGKRKKHTFRDISFANPNEDLYLQDRFQKDIGTHLGRLLYTDNPNFFFYYNIDEKYRCDIESYVQNNDIDTEYKEDQTAKNITNQILRNTSLIHREGNTSSIRTPEEYKQLIGFIIRRNIQENNPTLIIVSNKNEDNTYNITTYTESITTRE